MRGKKKEKETVADKGLKVFCRISALLFLVVLSGIFSGCALHSGNRTEIDAAEEQNNSVSESIGTKEEDDVPEDHVKIGTWKDGPSEHGQLRVENGILKDKNGETFHLRGMSTHGIGWFPDYINAGAMESVKNAGGNVMRIAMYTQADRGYINEPERSMELVLQSIENARAMDMYVIVDWHILDDGDPNVYLDRAITFFDAVASRYPGDAGIIYEVCNEPNNVKWDKISDYGYAICPVIRQYSPDAVVILGTPDFSSDLKSAMKAPLSQENILYAFHFYAGEHGSYKVLEEALKKRFPVMVSEWGIGKNSSGEPALKEGREFAGFLNENGISWCAWSLCNKDEVYSALSPDCVKLSRWEENDLTEVGKVLFSAMGGTDP